jgi:hypothetical protein
MQNLAATILSQYANSPTLMAIIESFNDAVDPSEHVDSFYDMVWNIDTAAGYGLHVWGRIVNIGNVIQLKSAPTSQAVFGFGEANDTLRTAFNQEPFYPGKAAPGTQSTTVSDKVFRRMILTKALSNVSDRAIPTLNQGLMLLFPNQGNAWVSDDGSMQCTYHFAWKLAASDVAVLKQTGVLPGPTGVNVIIQDITGIR